MIHAISCSDIMPFFPTGEYNLGTSPSTFNEIRDHDKDVSFVGEFAGIGPPPSQHVYEKIVRIREVHDPKCKLIYMKIQAQTLQLPTQQSHTAASHPHFCKMHSCRSKQLSLMGEVPHISVPRA
jgi:hypothetical protein